MVSAGFIKDHDSFLVRNAAIMKNGLDEGGGRRPIPR